MATPTYYGNFVGGSATLTTPLAVTSGGTGTSTPGLIGGTNVSITGTWPNQTINATVGGAGVASVSGTAPISNTGTASNPIMTLATPLAVNYGGTGTATPGLVAGTNVTISGAWPNQTINSTAGGVSTVSATGALSSTGGANPVITLTVPLSVANGGTGSTTLNFVDLLTAQSIAGVKSFSTAVNATLVESLNGNGVLGVYNVKDWGAVGNGIADDSASILAAVAAANLSSVGATVYFPPGKYYYNSATAITIKFGIGVLASPNAQIIGGAATTDCFVYSNASAITGGALTVETLPSIIGFVNGSAIRINTNERFINVGQLSGCLYGLQIQSAGGVFALDNTVNVTVIANCNYGVCLSADHTGPGGVDLEGNVVTVNFITACNNALAFLPISGATHIDVGANVFNIYAIDNTGCTANPNYGIYSPPSLNVNVGGYSINVFDFFGGAAGFVGIYTPGHSGVTYYIRGQYTALATIAYATIGAPATNSTVQVPGLMFGTASSAGAAMTTASGRAGFNGGVSPVNNVMTLLCPSHVYAGLGSTAVFYGYSWLLSGNTPIQARIQQAGAQFIVTSTVDNSLVVPNEFQIQLLSLAAQTSGCVLEITIGP